MAGLRVDRHGAVPPLRGRAPAPADGTHDAARVQNPGCRVYVYSVCVWDGDGGSGCRTWGSVVGNGQSQWEIEKTPFLKNKFRY
jgi:hypothetical protein